MTPDAALELLRPALETERPLFTIEDIATQLAQRNGVLWMGERSVIFTQFAAHPDKAEFVWEAGPAGGDLAELTQMIPLIEARALEAGATQAMIYAGRQGWARVLAPLGYEHYQTVFRKIL